MNKYSKILAIFVILFAAVLITGCGNKKESDDKPEEKVEVTGTYQGKYFKAVSDTDDKKNESDHFSVMLNDNGIGTHNRDGENHEIVWTLDGEDFKMTESLTGELADVKIEYKGTLKDGKLKIYNGDVNEEGTYEYYYEKD